MILHPVLGVRCERDLLLHHLAPIGLAAARQTALLVDLDPSSPAYPGRLTVADLVAEGVRRTDLGPVRKGVAVLGHGGIDLAQGLELVKTLSAGWPAVVIRSGSEPIPYPVIPVAPEFPAVWRQEQNIGVFQPVSRWSRPDGAAVRLPSLRRGQVAAMLDGRVRSGWRWVRAWRPVWEMAWD